MEIDAIIDAIGVTPYHRDEYGVLYCADCMTVLPKIPDKSVDLVLTDPPYNNMARKIDVAFTSGVAPLNNTKQTVGDEWGASLDWLAKTFDKCRIGMLVFCSFHSVGEIEASVGIRGSALLTWHKPNAMPPLVNAPHYTTEFIWLFRKSGGNWRKLESLYTENNLSAGCVSTGERVTTANGQCAHPTQKPISLMRKLIAGCEGDLILDPFCGSGTTLVAAKQLGRKYIGIEISEEYCKICVERLRQRELF